MLLVNIGCPCGLTAEAHIAPEVGAALACEFPPQHLAVVLSAKLATAQTDLRLLALRQARLELQLEGRNDVDASKRELLQPRADDILATLDELRQRLAAGEVL
jgi:hypothetical protein